MAEPSSAARRHCEEGMYPPDFGEGPAFDWPAIIAARNAPRPWLPSAELPSGHACPPPLQEKWRCWLCGGPHWQGKKYAKVSELYQHVYQEHWDKEKDFRDNPRYYSRCAECYRPFATLGEVMAHYQASHPSVAGGQCYWMFTTKHSWPKKDENNGE